MYDDLVYAEGDGSKDDEKCEVSDGRYRRVGDVEVLRSEYNEYDYYPGKAVQFKYKENFGDVRVDISLRRKESCSAIITAVGQNPDDIDAYQWEVYVVVMLDVRKTPLVFKGHVIHEWEEPDNIWFRLYYDTRAEISERLEHDIRKMVATDIANRAVENASEHEVVDERKLVEKTAPPVLTNEEKKSMVKRFFS